MDRFIRIYTRTGDKGKTSLGDGRRVSKYHARIEALGAIDEASSAIGLARSRIVSPSADGMLRRIQNDLFVLGAELGASSGEGRRPGPVISAVEVARLEAEIDAMSADLAPLDGFILPGGRNGAAELHLARSLIRRAERLAWRLAARTPLGDHPLAYVNRLSDHLFTLARLLDGGAERAELSKPDPGGRN